MSEGDGEASGGDGAVCSRDEGAFAPAAIDLTRISLYRGSASPISATMHRLHGAMARAKGHDRGDARGIHGRRAGGAEGQQVAMAYRVRSMRRSRRSVSDLRARSGMPSLSEVRRRAAAAGARLRAAGPTNARARPRDYDLGCGAGQHTSTWPSVFWAAGHRRRLLEEMLAKARTDVDKHVTFTKGDLADFKPDARRASLQQRRLPVGREPHRNFPGLLKLLRRRDSSPSRCRAIMSAAHALREGGRDGPWRDKSPRWAASAPVGAARYTTC